jgi:hypothetical protein
VYPQVALPITDLWNVKEVQYLTRLHSIILAFERSAIKMAMRLQYFNLMYVFPVYTVPGSLQNTDKYSSTSGIEAVCYWMGNDLRNMHAGFLWSHSAADNVKSYARCKCLASYYKDTYKLCSENISAPCNTHTHTQRNREYSQKLQRHYETFQTYPDLLASVAFTLSTRNLFAISYKSCTFGALYSSLILSQQSSPNKHASSTTH